MDVLPHPGYPDTGQTARHNITGANYIKHLASYRFMYLEPSRDELEFLKYSECAYAGCVPAGRKAPTLPAIAQQQVQALESNFLCRDLQRLEALSVGECEQLAKQYRETLARERDAATLSRQLLAHWLRQRQRLTGL